MPGTLNRSFRGVSVILLYALLYLALALAITYPLATHLSSGVLRGIDTVDALQQAWVVAWVQHALLAHNFNFFNAPIFYPTQNTLTYQDNLFLIAVVTMPVRLLWNNPLIVYNVGVIGSYLGCALTMFALAYSCSRDHRASFLAGLIFAYSPFRDRHIEHLNLLSAEAIPLIILAFETARKRGGALHWLMLGLCLAICGTLSLYYLAFSVTGIAIYIAVLAFNRDRIVYDGALRGVIWLAIGLGATLWTVWPYLVQQQLAGAQRRLKDIVYFSADIRDFLHAGPQSLIYGWSDTVWHIAPLDARQYLFPGIIAVVLAVIGARHFPGRLASGSAACDGLQVHAARLYGVVAVVLAVFTLGPYLRLFGRFTGLPLPYLLPYHLLPGFAGYRDVARFDQVAMAYLALAAALGAALLFKRVNARRAGGLFILLALAIALESWTIQRPLLPVASGARIPAVYAWLARQAAGPAVELPMCGLPGARCLEESWYMYYSAYHWHPLLNGGGGFFPGDWNIRVAAISSFPSHQANAMLNHLHDRYVLVHRNFPGYVVLEAYLTTLVRAPARAPHWTVTRIGTDIAIDRGPAE